MSTFLRKYNTATAAATHLSIPIIKRGVVDFAVGADWTPAAGDVKVTKDGDYVNTANITTLPTAKTHGNGAIWEFQFSATELSCKKLEVTVVDAATKAVEDTMFIIETYGNASAMIPFDLSDTQQTVDIAAGGIPVGAFATGALTADAIATDAITSAELAASAVTEISAAILTTALTESYAGDGAAPTLAQFLFMLWSALAEFAISGTTITCKQLDGTTTAMTFTLDDASTPTSRTRAS